MQHRRTFLHLLILVFALALAVPVQGAEHVLRLATTTSTDNSGLLKHLLPTFEKSSGYQVRVIAVGTGKALRMGQDGDVDVVMVHARTDEDKFIAAGYGVNRRDLMYNDFVIVGPQRDPAGIGGIKDAAAALARIAAKEAVFVSRGDESGTYKREQALWQATDIRPRGKWYRSIGQGMEQALQIASEMQGYTLADRGTWLTLRKKLDLDILVQGDTRLFNPYGVIAVNPARYPDANYLGAMAFIAWLTSPAGQNQIAAFKVNGESLFFPDAIQAKQASPK
jgi:tungstate transport system substrate-binding protein